MDNVKFLSAYFSHTCLLGLQTDETNVSIPFVSKVSVLIILFKCLLESPEIASYLLQSMTLGKSHSGTNGLSTDHSSTGSNFL